MNSFKAKYRVTGLLGDYNKGDVVDVIILNIDDDTGLGLCYHPPGQPGYCGSLEIVKEDSDLYWISYVDLGYVNVGGFIHPALKEILENINE